MGDAAGIGPEIVLKSFCHHPELFNLCRPLAIGSADVMRFYDQQLGTNVPMNIVSSPRDASYEEGKLDVLDLG